MRAVVHTRYGTPDVLRVEEVERPNPAADEVLVAVGTATVNRTDCAFRVPTPAFVRPMTGIVRPRRPILGTEFAGEVVAVGPAVTRFAVGERVFGVNTGRFGTHAEYVCVRQDAPIAHVPEGVDLDVAAAIADGAILALTCLRWGRVGAGQRVLVYGASGAIGTAAVQLAKHLGAHVTAVCNTPNVDTVRGIGADEVIDYTVEDFTGNGLTYDVVLDAVGKHSYRKCRRSVAPGGRYVTTDLGFLAQNPLLAVLTRWSRRRVLLPIPRYTRADVEMLGQLAESGRYRPVIDRRYPLEEVVAATRYVETEQKTGNVLLTVRADAG
ncbi:NAD(P)-dependent alcohol dehydrogenase [Pseudonocardia lacus]|uniref:NAD(P)-dependent alcohol dehydrogenase n=1 Tax=Pseudonocardia lacus TaxID=2835865 RepID=UPI0020295BAD|nr:NAD(P)-dependent alcohol dehydrogenase [Pseudonocardia lacus]